MSTGAAEDAMALLHHYNKSSLAMAARADSSTCCQQDTSSAKGRSGPPRVQRARAFGQLMCLVWRTRMAYWRDPDFNLTRYTMTVLFALMVGSIAYGKAE